MPAQLESSAVLKHQLTDWLSRTALTLDSTVFVAELQVGLWTKLKGATQPDGLVKETVQPLTTVLLAVNLARQFVHYEVVEGTADSATHASFALRVAERLCLLHGPFTGALAVPALHVEQVFASCLGSGIDVFAVPDNLNLGARALAHVESPLREMSLSASTLPVQVLTALCGLNVPWLEQLF
jgi:hypothetical protein